MIGLIAEKLEHFQEAFDNLWRVVCGPNWSSAFSEIEVTALFELNALVEKVNGTLFPLSFLSPSLCFPLFS